MSETINVNTLNARQDLKNLYHFLSNNLSQIAQRLNSQQRQEFWEYYQKVEGLFNQALFIGLLADDKVAQISAEIKNAKTSAEKILLNMQNVVQNLNLFKSAIDLAVSVKDAVGN